MGLFAVTTVFGPNWDTSLPRREQRNWDGHATFMDGLVDDGFVFLGGPIADSDRNLLVVEATDEREIETRMGEDPWSSMGLLRIDSIQPWTIWLDGRNRPHRG
ncbi:MAG: YciI family protein [Acidimicrobiales bacterium]